MVETLILDSAVITLRVMHHAERDDYTANNTTENETALGVRWGASCLEICFTLYFSGENVPIPCQGGHP